MNGQWTFDSCPRPPADRNELITSKWLPKFLVWWYPHCKLGCLTTANISICAGLKATCAHLFHPVLFGTMGITRWMRKNGDTDIAPTVTHLAERRARIRYRMNASVLFRWNDPSDGLHQGEGVTRDMSVAGAFILTTTCPPPNATVQVEVHLHLSDGSSKALMKADMVVLRVENDNLEKHRCGFSAVGKGFSLRTFSDRASRLVDGLIKEAKKAAENEDEDD